MAPAGDWTMLRAAVSNGADAVYFGLEKLNMRAKAANFSVDELPEIVSFCKEHKVKTFLTLNTIVFEEELSELEEIIIAAKKMELIELSALIWLLLIYVTNTNFHFVYQLKVQFQTHLLPTFIKGWAR